MLEIKHLKTLQTLAETHSVNLAADKLCMTQSALSHQIKQLEALLGVALFQRKSKPIEFTPAGQLLLATALEVLPKIEKAERMVMAFEQGITGRLFIGVDCHTCFEWLMPLMRPYHKEWHGVELDILNSFGEKPLKKLLAQQLDLVITSDPEPIANIDFIPLFSYELVAVLPKSHPLVNKQWLVAQDLAAETLIVYPVAEEKLDVFRRFLKPAGVRPSTVRHSELTVMMLQLVDSERGICVLPKWLVQTQTEFEDLPIKSLGVDGLWSTLYAATHKDQAHLPYIQDFIHRVAEKMQPHHKGQDLDL